MGESGSQSAKLSGQPPFWSAFPRLLKDALLQPELVWTRETARAEYSYRQMGYLALLIFCPTLGSLLLNIVDGLDLVYSLRQAFGYYLIHAGLFAAFAFLLQRSKHAIALELKYGASVALITIALSPYCLVSLLQPLFDFFPLLFLLSLYGGFLLNQIVRYLFSGAIGDKGPSLFGSMLLVALMSLVLSTLSAPERYLDSGDYGRNFDLNPATRLVQIHNLNGRF